MTISKAKQDWDWGRFVSVRGANAQPIGGTDEGLLRPITARMYAAYHVRLRRRRLALEQSTESQADLPGRLYERCFPTTSRTSHTTRQRGFEMDRDT